MGLFDNILGGSGTSLGLSAGSFIGGMPMMTGTPKDFAEWGADEGTFLGMGMDPLDLFGERAENLRNTISEIQLGSARDALAQQRDMLSQTNALLDPYRQAAEENLPFLESLAGGGDFNLTPQAQREWEQGSRQANAALSARGLLNSGARRRALADLATTVGQRDIGRQWGRGLDINNLGQGALSSLGAAGRGAGGAASSIYGNLGNALNVNMQNYGQQRQESADQFANTLYGLGGYLAQKG